MKRLALALLLMLPPAAGAQPTPPAPIAVAKFSDPAMEERARNLQRQLRCLVCQGESIDESRAPLAADLRQLVRQQMVAGKTDEEIKAYLVARFGNFVLMKPPLESDTWLLWLGPFLVLGAAGAVAWVTIKKASRQEIEE
jgi:cytochrome c-type biogenesis protein CcmH